MEYETKIQAILEDSCYEILNSDPTSGFEDELKATCLYFNKVKHLKDEDYKYITSTRSRIPRFYGLPKIHKEGRPLRPIVDLRHAPTYRLAKFLKNILVTLLNNDFSTKNAYHMSHFLKDISIPDGHELISFDVVSLFTKVPLQDTMQYIEDQMVINRKWRTRTTLSKNEVIKLLKICVKCNYFTWNKIIYRQNDGCPMGSPISPVLAELAMQKFESIMIKDNPTCSFFKRYVDDSASAIKQGTQDSVLQYLNSYHADIQFTFELEKNKSLPFLDLELIHGDDGRIKRKVYRKPTNTGRYLNFHSYHHISQKMSAVDALAFRAFMLCDADFLEDELDKIRKDFVSNNYPLTLINRRIEKMEGKVATYSFERIEPEEENVVRLILPYMGSITLRITNLFRSKVDCDFGYIPGTKIGSFICNMKEKLFSTPAGIYSIKCSCGSMYIGETNRPYTERVEEHLRKNSSTAVSEHLHAHPDHTITLDSASLLEIENRPFHRVAKEGLYIQNLDPNIKINKNNGKSLSPIITTFLLPLFQQHRNLSKR